MEVLFIPLLLLSIAPLLFVLGRSWNDAVLLRMRQARRQAELEERRRMAKRSDALRAQQLELVKAMVVELSPLFSTIFVPPRRPCGCPPRPPSPFDPFSTDDHHPSASTPA